MNRRLMIIFSKNSSEIKVNCKLNDQNSFETVFIDPLQEKQVNTIYLMAFRRFYEIINTVY